MLLKNNDVKIVRYDHYGRGIGYINDKIVFVNKAVPGDICTVQITKESKKYYEADIVEIINKSDKRIKSKCPYFDRCGGCSIRNISYDDSINFKKEKLTNILKKYAGLETKINVTKNDQKDNYRNKIELKIRNGKIGYFAPNSHSLVEIAHCLNAEEAINNFLFNIELLNLQNADITIKCNYNGELLLNISSTEEFKGDIDSIRNKHKLVGIIFNDELIYGTDHFIEIIDGYLFKESYNSFFQVNRNITSKLFELISKNVKNEVVLDLCCGVGTLSIVAAQTASKVYGIEIVENSIKDALINARMNKTENVEFILGDAFEKMGLIIDKIDTILIDPPRSGMTTEGIRNVLNSGASKIVYVSCDPMTLSRDISLLKEKYNVTSVTMLDMFSYSYHCESVAVLEKNN